MSEEFLRDYQRKAVENMRDGCILNGGVGSGKSRTGLYYYFKEYGGEIIYTDDYKKMVRPPDLYIITTALKRDKHEWEQELAHYLMSPNPEINLYKNKIVIDSWNNIEKYVNVIGAFFIFDEDRVTGNGKWAKTFIKISRLNRWIILSATPGDTWTDYTTVFIANGFFRNITQFRNEHIVYKHSRAPYPQIDHWINEGRLIRLRERILIDMECDRHTIPHDEDVIVTYNKMLYKDMVRNRWDIWKQQPMNNAIDLCYGLRRILNSDESRSIAVLEIFEKHPKVIIFYNFNYELEILRDLYYGPDVEVAEWNSHKHQPLPETDSWVYLVQYTAGAEGWNCIKTDTIIFYSQTYSWKTLEQAKGRINRMNTSFIDLYYYHLKSRSGIDLAISQALKKKQLFNEGKFVNGRM